MKRKTESAEMAIPKSNSRLVSKNRYLFNQVNVAYLFFGHFKQILRGARFIRRLILPRVQDCNLSSTIIHQIQK